jgi:PAS domain S-box-containing protein
VRSERTQRVLIGVVAFGGAAALLATWTASPPTFTANTILRVVTLTLLTVLAELVSIRLPHGPTSEQITLGEVAIAADVALLPVALAPLVATGALAISLFVRRRAPVKIAYNAGQYALATVAASLCFHGLGGGDFATSLGIVALLLGMAAFAGSNLLTISAIISQVSGASLASVIRDEYRLSLAVAIGNSSVGIVAVALWTARPLLVPVILGPALALHLAYRGWIRQRDFVHQMEDQKEKLERVVADSSEGIVLADASGRVLLWSPSMERISGLEAAEAEGKSLGYLLRGRAPDGASTHVEVGGEDAEIEVTRADGADRWLRVQHGPARDPDGALRWDVVLVHDVTTEHATEKMKEHFLATVSHELRTPLTPIVGYAKFLLRRDDVDAQTRQDALSSLLERAEHMQRLVDDLLLASSVVGSGGAKVHARREPVDIAEIVVRAVVSARVTHPNREIILQGAEPLLAFGDTARIRQVLANLIDNAVKFSPPDTRVYVRLKREGVRAAIQVVDHGRGIPTDKRQIIFEKFRRLEDPNTMETGGAGLGLFIVRSLVHAMGGSVGVDSQPGKGSTFTVRLEAIAGPAEAERPASIDRSA